MAGIGRWICSRAGCDGASGAIRRATTGATGGSRTTNATPATWRTCCGWVACRRRGSRRRRCAELRELVRYRAKLVQLRSGLKAQVHAVMAKEGVLPGRCDMFGPGGQRAARRDGARRAVPRAGRVAAGSDRRSTTARSRCWSARSTSASRPSRLSGGAGDRRGRAHASRAVFVAEIGDVTRFRPPAQLCSWAGLTPRHRESDTKVRRGQDHQTRLAGSCAGRRIEAVVRYHGGHHCASDYHRIAERRGKNKARVAIARKILTLVYYGLRDGEIRCLAQPRRVRLGHDPDASSTIGMTPPPVASRLTD